MASTSKTVSAKIRLRKDTRINWETPTGGNIVLLDGEIAIVVNNDNSVNFKIGNGITNFSSLPYITLSELKAKKISIDNTSDLQIGNNETLATKLNQKANLTNGKVPLSELPNFSGLTFDLNNIADCIRLCGITGKILGATVTIPIDVENGESIAIQHNLNPTNNNTYGDLQTLAGLSDTDTLSELY